MATNRATIHYALDLEAPPVIACDAPTAGAIYSPTASEVTCPRCRATEHFPLGIRPLRPDQERALIRPRPDEAPIVRPYAVLMNAADLLSDDGENEEYDRAIVELTTSLMGTDDSDIIARILRALKQGGM